MCIDANEKMFLIGGHLNHLLETGMMNLLSVLITTLLIGQCFIFSFCFASDNNDESTFIDKGKKAVVDLLKDPDSARFKDVFYKEPKEPGGFPVICGSVNARNSYGGYSGYSRFISDGTSKRTIFDTGKEEFEDEWIYYCSDRRVDQIALRTFLVNTKDKRYMKVVFLCGILEKKMKSQVKYDAKIADDMLLFLTSFTGEEALSKAGEKRMKDGVFEIVNNRFDKQVIKDVVIDELIVE